MEVFVVSASAHLRNLFLGVSTVFNGVMSEVSFKIIFYCYSSLVGRIDRMLHLDLVLYPVKSID